jgi:hypothetical protein
MTLAEYREALLDTLGQCFPQAKVTLSESRGLVLTCRAELAEDAYIAVYFNALTGKTGYALVHHGRRVAGCDNYRFWHRHPADAPDQHIPCNAPEPGQVLEEFARIWQQGRT